VVVLPENGGFAYGNNAGVRIADRRDCPYVLLLNPDTVVRPGAIEALVRFAEQNPDVGIFGSRLEDPDGTPQCSAFRFPGVAAEFEAAARLGVVTRLLARWQIAPPVRDEPHPCDWVAGACMLIRSELWDRLGGMDEGYFMYFEEVDFCLRAARAGFTCWYVPEARVVHLVGQASGVTDTKKPPKRRPGYWFESRQRYFRKNHGRFYAMAADLAWTCGHLIYLLHTALRRKPRRDPPRLLRDFLDHAFRWRAAR
jgi:GT2 family glycosyltransferase